MVNSRSLRGRGTFSDRLIKRFSIFSLNFVEAFSGS
jgi:hypothetical protein